VICGGVFCVAQPHKKNTTPHNIDIYKKYTKNDCVIYKCMYNNPMRIAKRAGIVIVLLIMLAIAGQPVVAQSVSSHWFPETRHTVSGNFYKFFYSVKDPLTQFGYPITNAFRDSTGRLTQYFQRARFDLVTTDKGLVVVLADLGRYLYEDIGAYYNIAQNGPTCRLFPRTGFNVCYAFLPFYDAYQGETYFGDPISGIEMRDGIMMQYFTKVRLEYKSNPLNGQWVTISMLGRPAYDKYVGTPIYLYSNDPTTDNITESVPVTSITARAFVRDPLLAPGQSETIYLIVQDQDLNPLEGAVVSYTAIYPDGNNFEYQPIDPTGADGVLKITLPVSRIAPRQVIELQLKVKFQELNTTTRTWFRIWY
jgi:hypothetical protein